MPAHRALLRLAAALAVALALSVTLVACDDDDEGGYGGGGTPSTETSGYAGESETTEAPAEETETTPDRTDEAVCKIGAKAIELIGAGLRHGSSARQIIESAGPGLENGCQLAYNVIKTLVNQPQDALDITIVDPGGSELTRQLNGLILQQQVRTTPSAGASNCFNYTTEFLYRLCVQAKLDALANRAVP